MGILLLCISSSIAVSYITARIMAIYYLDVIDDHMEKVSKIISDFVKNTKHIH